MKKTQPTNRPKHSHRAFGRSKHQKQPMHYDRVPRAADTSHLPTFCVIDLQSGDIMPRNDIRHAIGTSINLGKIAGTFNRYLAVYCTREAFVCL